MGISMLAVILMHLSIWLNPDPFFKSGLRALSMFAYTDTFFLLSGFGAYYSLRKNKEVIVSEYYRGRFFRVFVPYVFMSFPFYVSIAIIQKHSFWFVFSNLLTFNLWYEGNPYGMWYIGTILLLYLLFPFIYLFIYLLATISTITNCLNSYSFPISPISRLLCFYRLFHDELCCLDCFPCFFIWLCIGFF